MKKSYIFITLVIVCLSLFFIWWKNGIAAVNTQDKTERLFVVEKGAGVREIANKLKTESLITDPVVFFLLVKIEGLDGKIQAGDFRLSPSQTAKEIAENLTHGTLDIWVTIPEGQRADQIADTLSTKLQTYKPSWRDKLRNNEGYLFPDTYLIPKDADIDLIIIIFRENFEKKFLQVQTTNNSRTKNDIVTIASLVEREAKHPQDRQLVASVITNRLSIGMKLDIDAAVQYAVANQRCNLSTLNSSPRGEAGQLSTPRCAWWPKALTKEDIGITSLYNTYKNPGLPPTPIANPGLASLQAAANPASTNYLYYISDKQGVNRYAETLEEHHANIQKYGL